MRACALLVLAAAASAGCHRAPPDAQSSSASAPPRTAASAVPPLDHLAPGELVEGPQEALAGLKLPRDLRVQHADRWEVVAVGSVGLHPLVKYLRARVQDGTLDEGDTYATFDKVNVPGHPGVPYRVRLVQLPMGDVRFDMEDISPLPPGPPLPNEAARWKAVGMTPNGKLIDPMHTD